MNRAAVPKATVDEDREFFADEADVRPDRCHHPVTQITRATPPRAGGELYFVVEAIAL